MEFFLLVVAFILIIILFTRTSEQKKQIEHMQSYINMLYERTDVLRNMIKDKIVEAQFKPKPVPPTPEVQQEAAKPAAVTEVEMLRVNPSEAPKPVSAVETYHAVPQRPHVPAQPPKPAIATQSYHAMLQQPQMPTQTYHTMPQQPHVPTQSYHTMPQQPQIPTQSYHSMPQPPKPSIPVGTYQSAPQQPSRTFTFFNNENWVGVNLFNRVGVLLVIIGTIAIAAFDGFHPLLRTSILFALAFGVLGIGEFMNRKKPNVFSIGMSAAGVALTYVAIAASFFALGTLGMYAALMACIMATALGIFLATRYDAEVIGCFALVGGYLPIFSLDFDNQPVIIGIMVYFMLLTFFTLILALSRKWSVMNIIGYALTIAGVSYLGWMAEPMAAFVFACIQFLLYTAIPLIGVYRTKQDYETLDISLIVLNTFISAVVIMLIAARLEINNIHAYISWAFVLIYAGVAYWVHRTSQQKELTTLFILTSIAFSVMSVPFFFDAQWFTLAWLAIAMVLICFGILENKKISEYSGFVVFLLSVISLLSQGMWIPEWQFTFDYGMLTLGALVIFGCYLYRGRQFGEYEKFIKLAAFANICLFLVYVYVEHIFHMYYWGALNRSAPGFAVLLSMFAVIFALVLLFNKIKLWADAGTKRLSYLVHFAAMIGIWVVWVDEAWMSHAHNFIGFAVVCIGFALAIYLYLTEVQTYRKGIYKNINAVYFWLMLLFCLGVFMDSLQFTGLHLALITVTFAFGFALTRIQQIADRGIMYIAIAMQVIGIIWLWLYKLYNWPGELAMNAAGIAVAAIGLAFALYFYFFESDGLWGAIYKNINIVNFWLLLIFFSMNIMDDIGFAGTHMALITITFAFGFALTRIPLITDRGTEYIAIGMNMVGIIWLWIFNSFGYGFDAALLLGLNAVVQLMALYAIYDSLSRINLPELLGQLKIVVLSSYFLLTVTQTMMVQADVTFNSAIISIMYAAMAFAWVVVGFLIKNKPVRKAGLFLSMAAVAKLLIIDTWGLSIEMRIVSYLSLGLLLMLISYMYQKLSRISESE